MKFLGLIAALLALPSCSMLTSRPSDTTPQEYVMTEYKVPEELIPELPKIQESVKRSDSLFSLYHQLEIESYPYSSPVLLAMAEQKAIKSDANLSGEALKTKTEQIFAADYEKLAKDKNCFHFQVRTTNPEAANLEKYDATLEDDSLKRYPLTITALPGSKSVERKLKNGRWEKITHFVLNSELCTATKVELKEIFSLSIRPLYEKDANAWRLSWTLL